MVYIDLPLTETIRAAVAASWGSVGDSERLHGGEESAAYRVGEVVVRIGSPRRDAQEMEWCHGIAATARAVSEVVTPLPRADGSTVQVVSGHSPCSAQAFVDAYIAAGGTAGELDDMALAQLMRHRLRREAAYFGVAVARGVRHDQEDLEYHRQRLAAFHRLRPDPGHRPGRAVSLP